MTNEAPMPPGVSMSQRLWSEEVGIAQASDPLAMGDPSKEPGYEFSGRDFDSGKGPYAVPTNP
jgi:hypothetical protein